MNTRQLLADQGSAQFASGDPAQVLPEVSESGTSILRIFFCPDQTSDSLTAAGVTNFFCIGGKLFIDFAADGPDMDWRWVGSVVSDFASLVGPCIYAYTPAPFERDCGDLTVNATTTYRVVCPPDAFDRLGHLASDHIRRQMLSEAHQPVPV